MTGIMRAAETIKSPCAYIGMARSVGAAALPSRLPGWQRDQHRPGTLVWTLPSERRYTTHHHHHHRTPVRA